MCVLRCVVRRFSRLSHATICIDYILAERCWHKVSFVIAYSYIVFAKLILATIARLRWSVCLVFVMVCIYIECRLRWSFSLEFRYVWWRWSERDLYAFELNACSQSSFVHLAVAHCLGPNEPASQSDTQTHTHTHCCGYAVFIVASRCSCSYCILLQIIAHFARMRHANEHHRIVLVSMEPIVCMMRIRWRFTLSLATI